MNSRTLLTAAVMLTMTASVSAQKRIGDFTESMRYSLNTDRAPRQLQYVPDGRDFLCVNGTNRFTRALYGSHSEYRIETSDKPIFAIFKPKNQNRSLRFVIEANGNDVQLDKAEYCEARYGDGQRKYVVKDKRWGADAVLYLDVVAKAETEGAVWRFKTTGFNGDVKLKYLECEIAYPKLQRNGDMGADKAGCWEPSPTDKGLITSDINIVNNEAYAIADTININMVSGSKFQVSGSKFQVSGSKFQDSGSKFQEAQEQFNDAADYFKTLTSRITFTTPDQYLNTLGGALVLAADGTWDGETWQHGAIGWRIPLAGWRAGYLGDVLGWGDRAVTHFNAYANSQLTDQPVTKPGPNQDPKKNLARSEEKLGTEIFSNGYICRYPNSKTKVNHYDMNLNYIDELLWHFEYDADTAYMRKMWPVLKSHLAWEKRNFDSDNDHLYDAYCCIWASDALFYSDGAVTHSSAYNYRGNLLAAKIAALLGEDPTPYREEAEAIQKAMDERLWVSGKEAYVPNPKDIDNNTYTPLASHWAEYQDNMGLKRVHPDAALWSVYTPIDCGVGTPEQQYKATKYVNEHIPHINVMKAPGGQSLTNNTSSQKEKRRSAKVRSVGQTISTSDWMPYQWSINNVATAEVMHTALAYFEAGNSYSGYNLLMSNVMDQMYLGASPANFGQVNYYDAARGESYRDFADNVGISARALIQGLFGIVPNALDGKCMIRPGFPLFWDSCEVKTPYLSYKYRKLPDQMAQIEIVQNFSKPLHIFVRKNLDKGKYRDIDGSDALKQTITFSTAMEEDLILFGTGRQNVYYDCINRLGLRYSLYDKNSQNLVLQDISQAFNANVSDIFNNKYLSPRPKSTSLELPVQGVGEWCHPDYKPEINDSVFRSMAHGDKFVMEGITFNTPQQGKNIVYASLWDNYPNEITVPLKAQKADAAYLLMAGSTNPMQTRIDNALVIANYDDNTTDTLHLLPPFNWCPIEQDYYVDGQAFQNIKERPLRVSLGTGVVSDDLGTALHIDPTEVYGREIAGGAAQMLRMPLNPSKKVKSLTIKTLSNDVVIGLMAVTLRIAN